MIEIQPPDGWTERDPEKFEDQLFVSDVTYDDAQITKAYIAYYAKECRIEYCNDGNHEFCSFENHQQAAEKVRELMDREIAQGGSLLSHFQP